MYITKIYKYDSTQEANGYRGEDFSKYVLIGGNNLEDITQELDTGEITLAGMPIRDAFTPETKLIIDTVEKIGEFENIVETLHRMVQKDMVSQPILADDNYFDHHISLIEPSVVAQKRLVDNIATTYKLKDVNLQVLPAFPDVDAEISLASPPDFSELKDFGYNSGRMNVVTIYGDEVWGKYFQLEGQVKLHNLQGESFSQIYNDVSNFSTEGGSYKAIFSIPALAIYAGVAGGKSFTKIGYASIDYKIEEFSLNDEYNPTRAFTGTIISNSNLSIAGAYFPSLSPIEDFSNEWLPEECERKYAAYRIGMKKYTDINAPTPTYQTPEIEINPNRKYKISISLHQFDDDFPKDEFVTKSEISQPAFYGYGRIWHTPILGTNGSVGSYNMLTPSQTSCSTNFVFYDVNTPDIVYASSIPYSALSLLQKAMMFT